MTSTLDDLSKNAARYHLKRNRSDSPSGSSSSSSSSGYGSILSEDEADDQKKSQSHQTSQEEDVDSNHETTRNRSEQKSSDGQGHKLDINNKGMKLLMKMGWVQGTGLGLTQNGRKEPIPTPAQTPLLGLGKSTQDAYMLSNAISKPKELESLIIARETEEAKVKREEKVKVIQTRVVEREDRLKTFHCQVCDKGYTTISQFEEHERSYAHLHARRALEAKEARKATGLSTEARLEKERKREAKELERIARAAGMSLDSRPSTLPKPEISQIGTSDGVKKASAGWVKLPTSSASSTTSIPSNFSSTTTAGTQISGPTSDGFKPSGFKKLSEFKPVAMSSSSAAPISSGFKPIGRTNTECDKPSSLSPSTSATGTMALAKLPPTFIPSTSSSSKPDSSPADSNQPTSKFAQIAARLAARKAAAAASTLGDEPPAQKSQPKPAGTDYNSEIEKLLDI